MNYQIEIKDIEPIRVAYIRYNGIVSKASKIFPSVFKAISGMVSGSPFFCYYKMNPDTKVGEMDLCVPTFKEPYGNGVSVKEIPRVKAVCVTHVGSYETMNLAYKAIYTYAQKNNLVLEFPFREVYIKGPGMFLKGNPKKYITEIIFPIREEA